MPKIEYETLKLRTATLAVIAKANEIISEYSAEGFVLTLRQLYYQFVARGLIANNEKEYNKLGQTISNGRLAGYIDWEAITDRTRVSRGNSHWETPQDILESAANSYRIDTRADQDTYLEVWVEKDALVGVVESVCKKLDVPYFSCRGYVSQSAMWEAAQRILEKTHDDCVIIHLGDHDPSGIDMSRDIQERLSLFGGGTPVKVKRIALNMNQITKYNPPPNPAKLTDSRCRSYVQQHGGQSWELDALEPKVLTNLIQKHVDEHTDQDLRLAKIHHQEADRQRLLAVKDKWTDLEL